MSLKDELKGQSGGALEVRSLHDVQALTAESIETLSDTISESAFNAVRTKSAQKLAFKAASHTDGIVDDAIEMLEDFLPKMFVVKDEPLNLDIKLTIEAA